MKATFGWILAFLATSALAQQSGAVHREANRPKITGIDHVVFYTTSPEANRHLYEEVLGLAKAGPTEPSLLQSYWVGGQWVGYGSAPERAAVNRMDHVAFITSDCEALR